MERNSNNEKGSEITPQDIRDLKNSLRSGNSPFPDKTASVRRWLLNPTKNILAGVLREPREELTKFIGVNNPSKIELTLEAWYFIGIFPSAYFRRISHMPTLESPLITIAIPGIGSESTLLRPASKTFVGTRYFTYDKSDGERLAVDEVEIPTEKLYEFLKKDPYTLIRPNGKPRKLFVKKHALSITRLNLFLSGCEFSFMSFINKGKPAFGDFATLVTHSPENSAPPDIDVLGDYLGPEATGFPEFDLEGHHAMRISRR